MTEVKTYEAPEVEIIHLNAQDILTASEIPLPEINPWD